MEKKEKLFKKIYLAISSFMCVLLSFLILFLTYRMYKQDGGYSYTTLKESILHILVVIILFAVVIIFGLIYFVIKQYSDSSMIKKSNVEKLRLLKTYLPKYDSVENKSIYDLYLKNDKKRKIVLLIEAIILFICAAMGFLYLINPKHFVYDGNPTKQVKDAIYHLLPFAIIALISGVIFVIYNEYNASKSIGYVLKIKDNKQELKTNSNKQILIYRIAQLSILSLAIVLIIVGSIDGGASRVMEKAINICTECIGLG